MSNQNKACKHFGICGGCLYSGIPYSSQLEKKHEQIRDLFSPILTEAGFKSVDEGIIGSPLDSEYRNKMEFSFGDSKKDGPLELGMHKKRSFYDIVTVDECQLVDSDFRDILRTTLAYFSSRDITYMHKKKGTGYLRFLLVRKATISGQILIDLVTSSQAPEDESTLLSGWVDTILNRPLKGDIKGILHTLNDRPADVVEDQGTSCLYGDSFFKEKLLSLEFNITPFSFFQTNSAGAEVLYNVVRDFLPDKDGVLYDLYSGTGTIAQILSPVMKKCIGVEIVAEAVEAARENAKLNGLSNCEFIAGDVLKVLDGIDTPPDTIVLDPPRDGVHPKALPKILSYGVNNIIYISCKPSSLARDLPICIKYGYEVKRMKSVDMFPNTANCEVVALLSK